MRHYTIFKKGKDHFIKEIILNRDKNRFTPLNPPIEQIPNNIISLCIIILWKWNRYKEVGKRFVQLDKILSFTISEYEILQLIKVCHKQGWNLATGTFFMDYYKRVVPEALDELKTL